MQIKGGSSNDNSNLTNRRTFKQIRHLILVSLYSGRKTINQISNNIGVNWKTVENHITHLVGKALIKEVFMLFFSIVFIKPKV